MSYVAIITGGLGAGKSTALAFLRALGAETISADEVARIAAESPEIRAGLIGIFGDDLYPEGTLDRPLLASRAFVSDATRRQLNVIMHPKIEGLLLDAIERFRAAAFPGGGLLSEPILIIEIPLIEDVPTLLDKVDEVIAITAPRTSCKERAIARGMSLDDARARIELQCDDEVRESHAHTVIENAGGEEELKRKLREWWNEKHDD